MAPMNFTNRTKIATAGTTVALGALAAVAISAGSQEPVKATAPAQPAAAEVRTVVVHRTVRVVKHAKPKAPKPAPAPAAQPAAVSQPRAVPIAQTQSAPAPAPQPAGKPLTSKTSGGSGEDHEDDRGEAREDDHGDDDGHGGDDD